MTRSRTILFSCTAFALIVALAYGVTRFVFLLGRPALGISRGSASLQDSRADGFYLGTYTPNKRLITLRDSSAIAIPDAWVEHAWTPEFTLLLRDTKKRANGFNFYIPIPHSLGAPFTYAVELAEADHRFTRSPGMGYGVPPSAWDVFFDSLPDTVNFNIQEKKHSADSWDDAVITDTIQFNRVF